MTHSKEYITDGSWKERKYIKNLKKSIESQHARGFSIEFNYNFNFHGFFSNIVEIVEWKDVWSPFLAGLIF